MINPITKLNQIRSLLSRDQLAEALWVKHGEYAVRIIKGQTKRWWTQKQQQKAKKLLKEIVDIALEWMSF